MLGIKTLLIRIFTLLFLTGASLLLFSSIVLYEMPSHGEELKEVINKLGKEVALEVSQVNASVNQSTFDYLEELCGYVNEGIDIWNLDPELKENKEEIEQICEMFEQGEINNADELMEAGVDLFMEEQMVEIRQGINKQVDELGKLFPFTFGGFLILYILAGAVLFVDRMRFGNWVRRFSKYNFIIYIITAFIILIIFIFSSSIVGKISDGLLQEMASKGMDADKIAGSMAVEITGWFRGVIDMPMIAYFVLSALGLFGWLTGFGIRK